MKKWSLAVLAVLLMLALLTSVAAAQNYSFSLPKAVVNVYYNADGTAAIDYVYTFANDPNGPAIEYVDVGIPFPNFDLNSVSADVDGHALSDIQKANPQYLQDANNGVTIGLGVYSIQPGQTGTFHVHIGTVRDVLYPYKGNKPNYASLNFIPNYFGSQYVHGATDMTVTIHLPPGVQSPDEPVYYTPQGWPGPAEPQSGFDSEGRIYYTWHSSEANGHSQYTFGAAFPAKYVPAGAIVKPPPSISFNIGDICPFAFCLLFLVIIGVSIYSATIAARKRKLQYLPPKIAIEGHGIKRGLTAVEAAILMEQPMDKILTMVLFGVIKKNAAEVTSKDPLELKIADPLPADLHDYETAFLAAFRKPNGPERRTALQDMMIDLVKSVSEKMKGFSRKETVVYYQDIMRRAWEEVEKAETPEVKSQKFGDNLEWTLLDRDYDRRTRDVFGSGPVFVPMWWGRYDPVFRGSMGTSAPAAPSGGAGGNVTINLPSLPGSDFAASVAGGVQNFAASVLGNVGAFTGAITNKTNPVPPPSTTSTRWGGGGRAGGCACACACACAGCACACAGGGR